MSCVYKIGFEDCDEFYVGSSVYLHKRKQGHKSRCYNENSKHYNSKLYQFIREHNYKWEDVIIEIVEQHDIVLDTIELKKREQSFMDELKPTLNKFKAHQTTEELKEHVKKYGIKYREENNDIIKKRKKKYVDNLIQHNCECGGTYIQSKARHFKTKQHQDYLANLNKEN